MKSSLSNPTFIVIVFLFLLLFSCKEDEHSIISIEKFYSDFKGYVHPYSDYSDSEDIEVTIKRDGFSKATTTNSSGLFQFDALESGTYNLVFEKEGYGTFKLFGIRHFGYKSDTALKVGALLLKKSSAKIARIGIVEEEEVGPDKRINIELEVNSPDEDFPGIIAFIGRKEDVSQSAYDFYVKPAYAMFYFPEADENPIRDGVTIPHQELLKREYKSGDKIFIKFYTINRHDAGYPDFDLNQDVFSTLNTASVPALEYTLSF